MSLILKDLSTIPECPICLEGFGSNRVLCKTECGHIFHGRFLRGRLERERSCPYCRQALLEILVMRKTSLSVPEDLAAQFYDRMVLASPAASAATGRRSTPELIELGSSDEEEEFATGRAEPQVAAYLGSRHSGSRRQFLARYEGGTPATDRWIGLRRGDPALIRAYKARPRARRSAPL